MRIVARLLTLAGLGLAVFACASSAPSSNKPLPVCEEGTANCPNIPKSSKKPPKSEPTEPPSTPTDGDPLPSPEPKADAGADAASLGPLCTKLSKCCSDLEAAGYSPDTCKGIVDLKNEAACHAQHEQYREFGDCS